MSDDKKNKTAFIASEELSERIKSIQDKLNLKSSGAVISTALNLLEMSLGREVEFKDKNSTLKTKKFANLNQTIIIDEDDAK